jgi:GNAT superfamily N-acetyltransferase
VKITLSSDVKRSARVMQTSGMFDVPEAQKQTVEIDVPPEVVAIAEGAPAQEWQVGLIVGPSGSGKSSVARELFGMDDSAEFDWPGDGALLDGFPGDMGVKDVTSLLTAVGLGSPPAWLRPFRTLSNGEQFRASVARALAEGHDEYPVVIDEFTSVVDRQVAQVASHAVQKTIRRSDMRLVAVSCHYDIIEWLQPDWVYRPDTVDFEWRRLQRHPPLELQIYEAPKAAWGPFARHHYLSHFLHNAAKCYIAFIGEEAVAFNCHIPFPHPKVKNIRMGHRLVVLPDYQGLGIGLAFDNWLGEKLYADGYRYHKTISHPGLIHAYLRSPRWRMNKQNNAPRVPKRGAKRLKKTMASTRKLSTRSFRYIPERSPDAA